MPHNDLLSADVLIAPPDEHSAVSRSVGERIGAEMMRAAVAEVERMIADTGAAPRGVNSLHLVRAAWAVLVPLIDVHPNQAAHLWQGLASRATEYASHTRVTGIH